MARKNKRVLYQLKVTLQEIHPSIWRRIQIWEDATRAQLHRALQIIMGWEDYHLHEFTMGRRIHSVPDPDDDLYERKVIDEKRVRLKEAVPRVGTRFEYLYDFGDSWRHDLQLEAIVLPDPEGTYPCCLAGERRAPPEDVGGSSAYQDYLEAIADPEHEEHENVLQWRGPFHPEALALTAVNQPLQKKFRAVRKTATVHRSPSSLPPRSNHHTARCCPPPHPAASASTNAALPKAHDFPGGHGVVNVPFEVFYQSRGWDSPSEQGFIPLPVVGGLAEMVSL